MLTDERARVREIRSEISPRLGGPRLPQCKLCRVEVAWHERGVESDRPAERLQRMRSDVATAHRPVCTRFAELVPNLGVVRIQPRCSFERREETVTTFPPNRLRGILVQGLEQRLRRDQQALPGRQSVVQPAGPQQVHACQRVTGERAPLRDLSQSPPAQAEGAVQRDGPLVGGYGRVGLPLPIEPLSFQEGFERRKRARAERRSSHRGKGARTSQLIQETDRDRIDERIHPQRRASQLGLSHRLPRVGVVQRRRQLHRVRSATDEGSEHRQPGSGAPRDLGRRRSIRRSAPAAQHDRRRDGPQGTRAVELTGQEIHHPLPPEVELRVEHCERRNGDEVRVQRRTRSRTPLQHRHHQRRGGGRDGASQEDPATREPRANRRRG